MKNQAHNYFAKRAWLLIALFLYFTKASSFDFEVDGLYYNILSDNQVEVTYKMQGDKGYSGKLVIPEKVKYGGREYIVTSIGRHAFSGCEGLTGSLIIPNTVTDIGAYAFSGCKGFTGELLIPSSVKSIGSDAFWNCNGFVGTLTIPHSVNNIGGWAFEGCKGFSGTLVIPNSVTIIENGVFAGCEGLETITIHNKVESIKGYAFKGCSKLKLVESYIMNPFNIDNRVFYGISSTAKLQVLKGTKSKYEVLSGWSNNFKEISEISATTTYTLSISASGNGSVRFNRLRTENETRSFDVEEGATAIVYFYPDSGCRIRTLTVDGVNIRDEMKDNQYTIEKMSSNVTINVVFEESFDSFTYNEVNYRVASMDDKTLLVSNGNYGKVLNVPSSLDYHDMNWNVIGIEDEVMDSAPNLTAIIWNPEIALTINVTNPNFLLYVKSAEYAPSSVGNVVVNGVAPIITLKDAYGGNNFYCPQEFTAQSIVYVHNYRMTSGVGEARGWETIALPFDVQKVMHSEKGEIVPFASRQDGDERKPFWLMQLTDHGFEEVESIKAYTPYIISMPNHHQYRDDYILTGNVSFSAENVIVKASDNYVIASYAGRTLVPNFEMKENGDGYYALNVNNEFESNNCGMTEGSRFVLNSRKVHPFEAYMTSTSGTRSIGIFEDMTTGIREVKSDGGSAVYDLQGRKVNTPKKGIYIKNGKKLIIK